MRVAATRGGQRVVPVGEIVDATGAAALDGERKNARFGEGWTKGTGVIADLSGFVVTPSVN